MFGQATARLQDDYATNSRRRPRYRFKILFRYSFKILFPSAPFSERADRTCQNIKVIFKLGDEVGYCCFILADKARGNIYVKRGIGVVRD